MKYTIHPDLLLSIDDIDGERALVAETTSSDPPLIIRNSQILQVLREQSQLPVGRDEALTIWAEDLGLRENASEVWDALEKAGLLVPVDALPTFVGEADGYHRATRDHPFLDMASGFDSFAADSDIMDGYIDESAEPEIFLDVDHIRSVALKKASDVNEFELRFSALDRLALVLDSTFGSRKVQGGYSDDLWNYRQLPSVAKAVPSGGGKHPTEAFLVVLRHPDVAPGIYHYQVRSNSLAQLNSSDSLVSRASSAGFSSSSGSSSTATILIGVVMAAVVHRSMFRYRESRSFRAIPVDMGHLEGHMATIADYVGVSYRRLRGWDASRMHDLIGIDAETTPILVCGVLEQ